MANELNVSLSVNFLKSEASLQFNRNQTTDVAGDAFIKGVQQIGTSEEVLLQTDALGTIGYVYVKNLDTTNFVEVGKVQVSAPGDAMPIKLLPGDICLFPAGYDIYAKADTASCNVEFAIVEL
jgi:hypothetical protein